MRSRTIVSEIIAGVRRWKLRAHGIIESAADDCAPAASMMTRIADS